MKVYLLEAVDPEERKLRLHKVAKKARLLHRAWKMASKHGAEPSKFTLLHKWNKAGAIIDRDKRMYAAQRFKQNQWANLEKEHKDARAAYLQSKKNSKTDPEERSLRVKRLRDHAAMLGRAARNSVVFDKDPKAAASKAMRSRRAADVARAYSGQDPTFTALYKNIHGEDVRKLARGPRKIPPKPLPARIADALPRKKGLDVPTRTKRLVNLVNAGTRSALAGRAHMRGDFAASDRMGAPGKSPRLARDGGTKTAFDHGLDAERAHTLVYKFLQKKDNRQTANKVLKLLRKGHSATGMVNNWAKFKNPLTAKLGVRTDL